MDPLTNLKTSYGLAGQRGFGLMNPELFQEFQNIVNSPDFKKLEDADKSALRTQLLSGMSGENQMVRDILDQQARYASPEYQEQMLELADKYQTKKGVKQTAFNMFGSGFDSLMKGIGMSMNPYGTPEGLQNYLALTVAAPEAMAAGYRNLRTPMNIPAVQPPGAPTYF